MMFLFSKKKYNVISLINNETLYFVDMGDKGKVLGEFPVDRFMEMDSKGLIDELKIQPGLMKNILLVVPDYWIGNETHSFKSKKASIIEPFIERKLQKKFPANPEMIHFYDYLFSEKDQRLYVIYLQEAKALELYKKLNVIGLGTHMISTPALLWEFIFKKKLSEFSKGGKAFIHHLSSECLMYFFSNGNFVFSRNVIIPESLDTPSEDVNIMAYELNQSLYLFSQEAKEEIQDIYLLYGGEDEADNLINSLSDKSGRDIINIREIVKDLPEKPINEKLLGPVSYLTLEEIIHPQTLLTISHRQELKALEWRPILKTGTIIGLILLLLMGAEYIFLYKKNYELKSPPLKTQLLSEEDIYSRLDRYERALNIILEDIKRPPVVPTILKLIDSLPDNVLISELRVDVKEEPQMDIQCIITADGPEEFKKSLMALLSKLKEQFPKANNLGMDSIKLSDEIKKEKGREYYRIEFKLYL